MWALDDSQSKDGEAVKVLALHIANPPLTESEITWKKGVLSQAPWRLHTAQLCASAACVRRLCADTSSRLSC